jgi:hypothetical protein
MYKVEKTIEKFDFVAAAFVDFLSKLKAGFSISIYDSF